MLYSSVVKLLCHTSQWSTMLIFKSEQSSITKLMATRVSSFCTLLTTSL